MVDLNRNWFQQYGKNVTLADVIKDCRDLVEVLKQQDSEIAALKEEIKKLKES